MDEGNITSIESVARRNPGSRCQGGQSGRLKGGIGRGGKKATARGRKLN